MDRNHPDRSVFHKMALRGSRDGIARRRFNDQSGPAGGTWVRISRGAYGREGALTI